MLGSDLGGHNHKEQESGKESLRVPSLPVPCLLAELYPWSGLGPHVRVVV